MHFLNTFSKSRLSWLLLLAFIIFFEGCALFFQHVMKLDPCVMCVYERVAMAGIAISAIIGLMAPHNTVIRWVGLLGWGYSAYHGLVLSIQHVSYQFPEFPWSASCDLVVNFPSWAPLNQWVPWMFEASGDCAEIVWEFLGLSMPQWLEIIFAANLAALAIIVVAQFFGTKKN
ncbi:disulfide bond formation protein DsbB [Photobacterium nomapromontoriensis]|uniref:disulfide bond formation protein DsbB n=1 Tax=Photobacterium nomapromontoriensis TaxID=2910237 RepID=UPI003D0DBC9C